MKLNSVNILGVRVSALTYERALATIFSWVSTKQKNYVCVAAAHLVMECQDNAKLRAGVNKAGLVTPDGMPLVWLLKLYGQSGVERVYGPDLMLKSCEQAAKEKRSVFLLGGARGQSAKLKKVLQKKFPGLKVVGAIDTPIRPIPPRENQAIVRAINASQADLIFVGLGCPLQEQWMIQNLPKLKKGVAIGVGAAFDFFTGAVQQAPPLLQNLGLEWLFRLAQEPRRLARRYILLNTRFVFLVAKQILAEEPKS